MHLVWNGASTEWMSAGMKCVQRKIKTKENEWSGCVLVVPIPNSKRENTLTRYNMFNENGVMGVMTETLQYTAFWLNSLLRGVTLNIMCNL